MRTITIVTDAARFRIAVTPEQAVNLRAAWLYSDGTCRRKIVERELSTGVLDVLLTDDQAGDLLDQLATEFGWVDVCGVCDMEIPDPDDPNVTEFNGSVWHAGCLDARLDDLLTFVDAVTPDEVQL